MLMILGFVLLGLAGDAGAQVYRCGNTYSQEPCKGGREVDVSPAFSDRHGPKTKEIYLCRAPQGGLYWTVEHCGQRGWTIERTERVPANVSWEDQLAAARRNKADAEALAAPPAPTYYTPPQTQAISRSAECEALDAEVKRLDSMGRAGSRYYDLDWIRAQRKEARDRQFRLRC